MKWIGVVAGAVLLVALAGISVLEYLNRIPEELPRHGSAPSLSLTNQDSQPFTSENLRDRISVINFFFASCPGPCPLMNKELEKIARLYASNKEVQFVSITVDPERDSPERLKAYGNRFGADELNWSFLTGEKSQISQLANKGFKVGLPPDVNLHSTRFVLVDRKAEIRGYYRSSEPKEVQELVNAIAALLYR